MKKFEISRVTRAMNICGLHIRKHSPAIFVAVGIVGAVTGAVMACRATLKLEETMEGTKEELDAARERKDGQTEEEHRKELGMAYIHAGTKLAKLYAPSVTIGVVSIASLLAGNRIIHGRYAAASAACAAAEKSFKDYCGRVEERFGKDVEKELRYGIKKNKTEETVPDGEGGEKTIVKEEEIIDPADDYSPYAKFFDSACIGWEKDPEYNLMFLRSEQAYANDRLRKRGYLFLNEVYERLGIPQTKAGQLVGWIYDGPDEGNRVDFGIYDGLKEKNRDFINGYEPVILLDFNVDGNILDKI